MDKKKVPDPDERKMPGRVVLEPSKGATHPAGSVQPARR